MFYEGRTENGKCETIIKIDSWNLSPLIRNLLHDDYPMTDLGVYVTEICCHLESPLEERHNRF